MRKSFYMLIFCLCVNTARAGVIAAVPGMDSDSGQPVVDLIHPAEDWVPEIGLHDELMEEGGSFLIEGGPMVLLSDTYLNLTEGPEAPKHILALPDAPVDDVDFIASINEIVAMYGDADDRQHTLLHESKEPLSDIDFVLARTLHIDWSGTVSSRADTGLHVTISQIPEPASIILVIMVSGLGLIVRRRFRS